MLEPFRPAGNVGNIAAYRLGFTEAFEMGWASTRPRMMGFQAEGAVQIVKGEIVEEPGTVASAIRAGNPASWDSAIKARDESMGTICVVSDEEILAANKLMAQSEGIFRVSASAAAVAGLFKLSAGGLHLKGEEVVWIPTGAGLKDPDPAGDLGPGSLEEHAAELSNVERAMAPA